MKRSRYDDDDDEEESERPTHRLMIRTRNNDEIVYPPSPKSESEDSIDRIIRAMEYEIHAQDRDRAISDRVDPVAYFGSLHELHDLRAHARYARQFYESEDELWDGIYAPSPVPITRQWLSQNSDDENYDRGSNPITTQWLSQEHDEVFVPIPGVRALYPQSDTEEETLPNQVVDDQDVIDNFPNAYDPTQVVTQDDDDATASQTGDALEAVLIARDYVQRALGDYRNDE